jgi:alkylation response protein AidB-like acyl-CoA dehydrogenase
MDFTPTPEATEAAELAARILTDRCTPERLRAVESAGEARFDRDLWRELAGAGLLGLAVPEQHGGAGLGLLEATAVLVEAGRRVAPVPLTTHVVAALAVAEHAPAAVQQEWLPRAAAGDAVLTAAVWRDRTGAFGVVPAGTDADALLLAVGTGDDRRLVLLTPGAPGVSVEPQRITDGDLAARVTVDEDALVDAPVLGGADVVEWLADRLTVAEVAHQLGVVEGALRLTAAYAGTREQFGRPIGSFQAVSQRLADGYIDVLGARLMLWQAAWRLAEGLPASVEVAEAALWAADTGHRLAHTTVHVHGGVGIDLDGEAHRYFTGAKRGEFLLGGATAHARTVGAALASA